MIEGKIVSCIELVMIPNKLSFRLKWKFQKPTHSTVIMFLQPKFSYGLLMVVPIQDLDAEEPWRSAQSFAS